MREPAAGRDGGALFGDAGEAAGGEQVVPAGQLGGEPGQQPGGAFVLGAGDHRAAVRQAGQRQQGAVAAVDPVEVQVRAAVAGRRGGGQDAQQLGPPGPRRADRQQVPEGVQAEDRGLLPVETGKINQAERDGRVPRSRRPVGLGWAARCGQVLEQQDAWQRRQPGAGPAGMPRSAAARLISPPGLSDQAGHEIGQVADQGRELVDHDHQPGQR